MSRRTAATLAAAILLWGAGSVDAAFFDVLYIKANVGESAGGHSAVRFDDDVYHFQNDAGDILRLRRTPESHFRWTYAVLQNRTIRVARIGVTEETRAQLHDAFNRRFLLHNAHARILTAHRRDRELLDALIAAGPAGEVQFPLRGAGLFADAPSAPDATRPPALDALRTRIRQRYGPTFLPKRLARLRARLRMLRPITPRNEVAPLEKDQPPTSAVRFSERYEALGLRILALDILHHPRPIATEALRDPGKKGGDTDESSTLSPALRRQLLRFAADTEQRLVTLAGSESPNSGYPLLLGMARLEALHASQVAGRLIVLDAFPADAARIDGPSVVRRHRYHQELADHAATRFAQAHTRILAADPVTERDFGALEEATNRHLELSDGVRRGRPVRISARALLPATPAPVPELPPLARSMTELRRDAAQAAAAHDAYVQALETTFGYHLLNANCATEILTLIESTLGRAETTRRLGGHVGPDAGLHFVPALAHRAVLAHWNVTAVGEIPSFRRASVDAMYTHEFAPAVYLREANRLTSTVYRTNNTDAFFLFFTDDTAPPRPLYGLANIAAGAGQTLWGTLRAPFDRGATLRAGISAIVFSLPELAWINIRKGTFEYGQTYVERLAPRMRVRRADHARTYFAP